MDKEPAASATDIERSLEAEYGHHPLPCARKPGRRQKKRKPLTPAAELLLKTQKHFFPDLSARINKIPDPRRKEQIIYSQAHLLWNGILLFMMHLGSRRQMRFERDSETFEKNLIQLCGQSDARFVADPDTLAYYAERVPCEAVEKVLASMTTRLFRMKALDPFRLYGYCPVAIDGSQVCTFDHEPWPGCPHRKLSNGSLQYFSYVLLLIAHYITQLILHGNLIRALVKSFGSAKNFARRLSESLRNHLVPEDLPLPGQIRFRPP